MKCGQVLLKKRLLFLFSAIGILIIAGWLIITFLNSSSESQTNKNSGIFSPKQNSLELPMNREYEKLPEISPK
jgi:hypothetical protein